MDLAKLSPQLTRGADGIWIPRREGARVDLSFPKDGHEATFRLEDESFWVQHRNACIFHALHRVSFEGLLLDVGAGNGVVSQALERGGLSTVVLEPALQGARNARRRGLANVVCATLDDADFEERSFGAAGVFDVIEHVEDDVAVLRSVHRVLRPGGALCVTVPAYPWLWSAEDELAGHFRRYTLASLRATLVKSAFDVRYETYFFATMTLPVFLMRTLRHRLGQRSMARVEESAVAVHDLSTISRRMVTLALAPELRLIRSGKKIPVGTSCLVVATKA